MNINWSNVKTLVEESILNKEEKSNVLEQLDRNIGRYSLNYKLPLWHQLTENEYIEFARIVKAINEENDLPTVSNDAEYKVVVNEIVSFFSKQSNGQLPSAIADIMTLADQAYAEENWEEVNRLLQSVSGLM